MGHFLILDVNRDTKTRREESWSPGQIRKVLSGKSCDRRRLSALHGANPVMYLIVIFDDYSLFLGVFITFYFEFVLAGGLFSETPGVLVFRTISIIILFAFTRAHRGFTGSRTVFRSYFLA